MYRPALFLTAIFLFIYSCNSYDHENDMVSADSLRDQFQQNFNRAAMILDLAKAIPADQYSWRPQEDAMSFEEVFTHVAHYNYLYPATSLNISAPVDIEMESIESIRGKEAIITILDSSIKHVKRAVQEMPNSTFGAKTELYNRTVNGQAVLLQLITHKSEHFGQSIAYARMNGIVPPWNR